MHIIITRYYESPEETKGELCIDGVVFGEVREPGTDSVRMRGCTRHLVRLEEGVYRCRITASALSPMSLKVRRSPGQESVYIGWDPVASWRSGYICIGQGDPLVPPEERELADREGTFERFTQRLYHAFGRGEGITLEVRRVLINHLTGQ